MNPKDKANELANKMYRGEVLSKTKDEHIKECEEAKKSAIIAVEEIIADNPNIYDSDRLNYKYWNKVKEEIQKL